MRPVQANATVGPAVVRMVCNGFDLPDLECSDAQNPCIDFTVLAPPPEPPPAPQVAATPLFTG
jgi:hypothetical protein